MNRRSQTFLRGPLAVVLLLLSGGALCGPARPASSIPAAVLLEPADFAAALHDKTTPRPVILQVGFRSMFDQAHIEGAWYAGPGNDQMGLQNLRTQVATLPKDASIVIYCGCCPWSHCPNIAAAYDYLQSLGYSHVKVLHIETNFGTDWVEKGYPVTRGP